MTHPTLNPTDNERDLLAVLERLAAVGRNGAAPTQPAAPEAPPLPPPRNTLPGWSDQGLRDLVEALPDAVVVIDEAGAIVLVNRQTEVLFGYTRGELMGQAIEILVPERVRADHVAKRQGYFAPSLLGRLPPVRPLGGGNIKLFGRRKHGEEFPVEISLSPLRTPAGLLVTSVVRDVSDRKREEAKFRALIENIPAVTFIAPLDRSAPELYVSPQIEQMLGFSQAEWLADPVLWHRQLHPDDQERWNSQFAPTCAEATPFRSVDRFIAKDGRVVWVHGSANLVADSDGRLLFLQGVAFDVTAIKEAEEALREQARLATLRADVSAACTRGHRLLDVLQGSADALAAGLDLPLVRLWTCEGPVGALVLQVSAGPCAGADSGAAAAHVAHVAIDRSPLHLPDDARLGPWAQEAGVAALAAYPLLIEDHLVGVLAVFARRPLSAAELPTLDLVADQIALGIERKQAEEALLRANAELERRVSARTAELARTLAGLQEKTRELEQFAYHASHDLKEPLRTMRIHTQRLQKDHGDVLVEKALSRVRQVIDGADNMERLIEKLREYEHVNKRDRNQPVDLLAALGRACHALEGSISESHAEVVVHPLPTVLGVFESLMLLFQNLISNAIKYRDPARPLRVEVGAQRQEDGWMLFVRDNGTGIEPRYFEQIFRLGERLVTRRTHEGWGYGLAICKKTAERHGGRIWVESEPGAGSTFCFTLPDNPPEPHLPDEEAT
jgi:PAS domain S-box-containing protein